MRTRVREYYNFRLCRPQLQVQGWKVNESFWCAGKMTILEPHWDNLGQEFDVEDYEKARRNAYQYSLPVLDSKDHVVFEDGKVIS